ncbi:4-hydroxy-tetrahydrodipicolinate synthase [uncultured Christiangramia sp.]|uniref:4-hydroxy-tetrahydrodipicolinate synthase n=1 Tax=uncultured Christiangramia sp. TaxID=503836 RepID=UPI0025CBB95E|nr:4-hydroxy-tetrahydrodipicolinate synthase [uncultured Christiangramia sp.]|tara:strand:+ start:3405 stop:4280 length:876 start_codon:yes stop_codon:yes gene_type:complete
MEAFIGTGVALVTPFNDDLSVDTNALSALVKDQIENGIEYLVVLGTTAESATLSKKEKELVKTVIKEANQGKLPLVLGMGGNDTAGLVEELISEDLEGFDAILSVSPFYNKPTQEGIYRHFKAVAEASPLPVILYNVPGRTASNILPETINRIARDFKNVIGVKEAAGDIVQAMKLISLVPEDFLVISGDDMITLPMTLAGGKGVISVIGQGLPKEFSEMVRLGLKGEVREAYKLHYRIAPSIDMIFAEGNPAGIKAMLHKKSLVKNNLRLPLVEATDGLYSRISAFVESF